MKPVVVYVITKLELGGAQKVCLSLFERIAQLGGKTILISGSEGTLVSEVKKKYKPDDLYLLKSLTRELSIFGLFREVKAFWEILFTLRKIKKKYPGREIIVHTHSTKAGLMGRWAAWAARVSQIVHTVHGFGFHPYQRRTYWLANYIFEYLTSFITDKYICVSEHDRSVGQKYIYQFSKKSEVIRAAVAWDVFSGAARAEREPVTSKKFVIGSISCFKPQKNLSELFRAFAILKNQYEGDYEIALELVGDGLQRKELERLAKRLDIAQNIRWWGWQKNTSKLRALMENWDLFSLSSLWEGLPCSVIEARLLGIPVACYDVGGIREVIQKPSDGVLIRPGDYYALAQYFREQLDKKEIGAQKESERELEKIGAYRQLAPFSDQVMALQHWELYQNFKK